MATTQGNPPSKASDENKTTDRPAERQAPVATDNSGDVKTHASKMVGYRGDHIGAREAAIEAGKQTEKDLAEAQKNAVPAEESAFAPVYYNQVPQEGALVETPPQPVPPPYTDDELREMDHAPAGLREPSVAAGSDDTDQTVHPASRVNDPTKPL